MRLDSDRVRTKLQDITRSLDRLRRIQSQDMDSFLADEDTQDIARSRNRLVHMYWDVDYSQVYEILSHNLTDLDAFSREVVSWL